MYALRSSTFVAQNHIFHDGFFSMLIRVKYMISCPLPEADIQKEDDYKVCRS